MENNEQNRIRKYLYNEISLGIAIISAAFWLFTWLNNPIQKIELDIALMQKDLEIITKEHVRYSEAANERDKKIIEMEKKIERILTILEKQ